MRRARDSVEEKPLTLLSGIAHVDDVGFGVVGPESGHGGAGVVGNTRAIGWGRGMRGET